MKVGFAGTPEFARTALEAILDAGFDVPLVLTRPDRRAGRGMQVQLSAVKQLALVKGIVLAQPRALRLDGTSGAGAETARRVVESAGLDVLVVAAYGLILPPWLLTLPRLGCLNIHASLLPRWRGAAPIERAIEAGDKATGITIMQIDAGLDTGPMLRSASEPIEESDSAQTLRDRLAALGAREVVEVLQRLAAGEALRPRAQPAHGVTYAQKIEKTESPIDWAEPATRIERRVRAFDPFPGMSFELGGKTIKVWRVAAVDGRGKPGEVLPADGARLVVACASGALELLELQRPGGRRSAAARILQGQRIVPGMSLGSS